MVKDRYLDHGYELSQEKQDSIRIDVQSIIMIYRERQGQTATRLQNAKEPLNKSPLFLSSLVIWAILASGWVNIGAKQPIYRCFSRKKADYPRLRLRKVFDRQSQGHTDWHRRTWRTAGSRFSSILDTLFSGSQTDS